MNRRTLPVFATAVSLVALTALTGCAQTSHSLGTEQTKSATPMSEVYVKNMEAAAKAADAGDLQSAAALYGRASSLAPDETAPLIALSDVLWRMKNASEAAKVLERARQIDPNNSTVLRNLGRAYVAQNNTKEATNAYLAALAVDPSDTRTLSGLGIAYDMSGDHDTAQRHYRAGLAIEPYSLELQNNLAYSMILSGDHEGAVDILEPLVNRPGATPRQRQNLAMAYGMLGKEDDVRRVAAVDLSPVEIERNLKVYRNLRLAGDNKGVLKSVGAPTFDKGGLSTEPAAQAAEPPAPVSAPEQAPVDVAELSAPAVAEEPIEITPTVAPKTVKAPAPKVEAPLAKAPAPAVAMPKASEMVSETAPAPVAVAAQPAPAVRLTDTPPAPSSATAYGISGAKVYLGKFTSEAAAREAWIKVWTSNSTLLGSLVAGIEPAGDQFSLYGVGADSSAKAEEICAALRAKGVSCGVSG